MKRLAVLFFLAFFLFGGLSEAFSAVSQEYYPATPYGDHLHRVLKSLEARRDLRQAEAQRMNILLPSQPVHERAPLTTELLPGDVEDLSVPAPQPPLPMLNEVQPHQEEFTEAAPEFIDPAFQEPAQPTSTVSPAAGSPFQTVLSRLQAKRGAREREAARLGVILPSQGGSIQTVSPALGNLHETLRQMQSESDIA
jgi:hypothetical protein